MNTATYPLTIYYDASCPLCNGEMSNLMLRNVDGLLAFVDASPPTFVSPLAGISREDLMSLLHARKANGEVVSGVEVFRLAYGAVGLGWVTAPTSWPVLGWLADKAYPVLARNRYRIPRGLVTSVFEGVVRRAAEQAAQRARCTDKTCQL
ncbi:MAG TPA: DUF393 domain-containing protein [Aquabacterium sp.]|uniref:thiol-disulfide oxidoreductase DCC family protein n=1 Tax=Aquabacterium sp. TaxID=1872578 RepID=UPI002E332371|nr:DUF393 domain-containing protein [Aquabacterium sp.]HEX5356898.1 DUF393 domain-containing protein [Aquabacterium sp.]